MTNQAPISDDQSTPRAPWSLVPGHFLVILVWSLVIPWAASVISTSLAQPAPATLYTNDFQSTPVGPAPEDLKVLTGEFSVKEEAGNRFLEVGTEALNSFGVMIGPDRGAGTALAARVRGGSTGKRFPEFGVGLGGVGGLRLMLMPAVNEIQIRQGDRTITHAPFTWKSGSWVHLSAELTRSADGKWSFAGKAWMDGDPPPASFLVRQEIAEEPPTGRSVLWAMPYSEKPIQFDDVRVIQP